MWVGFLYTVLRSDLSGSGEATVTKNGMDPLEWVVTVVNLM